MSEGPRRGMGWLGLLGALAVTLSPAIPLDRAILPRREEEEKQEQGLRAGKPQFTPEEQAQLAKLSGKAKKAMVRELMAKHSKVGKWTS